MPQPYPTPPRGATGQALWSYLYQLAEQLNAQAEPADAASETATPTGGSAARIAEKSRRLRHDLRRRHQRKLRPRKALRLHLQHVRRSLRRHRRHPRRRQGRL